MSQLAAALDVRDHRFGSGPPFTVGVEEEYMLLDPESFDLVPGAERILEAERDGVYAEHIAPELFDSLVEFHTGVCATLEPSCGACATMPCSRPATSGFASVPPARIRSACSASAGDAR